MTDRWFILIVSLRWKQRKLFAKQLSWFVSLYQGCQTFLRTLNRYLTNARVKCDFFILEWIQDFRDEGWRNGLLKAVSCKGVEEWVILSRKNFNKIEVLRNGISVTLRPNRHVTNLKATAHRRFFVGRQKIFTCRLVCGEFRQVCDKIGACRAISDSARSQNVLSRLVG